MHILLVTDAWYPQVNGVVRTLDTVARLLRAAGHRVTLVTPEGKLTFPLPTYPEIRLALVSPGAVARQIDETRPDCIHIATEGPLGWFARRHCLKRGLAFTTTFHSRFPEMIAERLPRPGIASRSFEGLPQPVMLNAGRVAIEKNIDAFLSLKLSGTKVVVGDGPQLAELKFRYPDAVFTGYLNGDALAGALSAADVFVFPSRTDTFGLVMLEALACGVPVAAFPVEGPIDVITSDRAGCLDADLGKAIRAALGCHREDCIAFARQHSWQRVAAMFEQALVATRQDLARPDLVADNGHGPV